MDRLEKVLQRIKEKGEKALVAYITAGDPDLVMTRELILALASSGVDIVEVGVPFSDPVADGPIIQAASRRALGKGTTLSAILDMIGSVRQVADIPMILFGYYNPIFVYGNERFARKAQEAGLDGVLVADLPLEEAKELRRYTDPKGIAFISLIAPTTPDKRIDTISRHSRGFLYLISITGVTGTTRPEADTIKKEVERIRTITRLPLMVGFGISRPEQVTAMAPYIDGVVVGSAFMRLIEENRDREDLVAACSRFAREMKRALR